MKLSDFQHFTIDMLSDGTLSLQCDDCYQFIAPHSFAFIDLVQGASDHKKVCHGKT